MNLQSVSQRAKMLWLIKNLMLLLVVTAGVIIALVGAKGSENFILAAVILGICWLVIGALLVIWPSLKYKNYAYGCDDKRFYLKSGVIFRHQITAPVCQIQDLHFFEGPLMRLLGLGKIMLSTGGSNFELVGMEKHQAQALIEEMESRLRARIEVQSDEEV